jgi:CBS domain-containing protein
MLLYQPVYIDSHMMSQEYLSKDVKNITTRTYVTLNEDNSASDAVEAMRNGDVSSIIIANKTTQQPIGIVTERDILYRVIGENRNASETTLRSIMSHPLISVDDRTSIKEAICIMI